MLTTKKGQSITIKKTIVKDLKKHAKNETSFYVTYLDENKATLDPNNIEVMVVNSSIQGYVQDTLNVFNISIVRKGSRIETNNDEISSNNDAPKENRVTENKHIEYRLSLNYLLQNNKKKRGKVKWKVFIENQN